MSDRKAIPGDLDFDPTYFRQRLLARFLLGAAINKLRGGGSLFEANQTPDDLAEQISKIALQHGLIYFDDFHHAPACPANNWHQQRFPTAPCNCGAERAAKSSKAS